MAERDIGSFSGGAFLGERSTNDRWKEDLRSWSAHVDKKIINPGTVTERKEAQDRAREFVSLTTRGRFDSIGALKGYIENNPQADDRETMEKAVDFMGQAVYMAMSPDPESQVLLATSPQGVDDRLPDALKGLGENVVENEIGIPEVTNRLKMLDKVRGRVKGRVGQEGLRKQVETAVMDLQVLDVPTDQEGQLQTVLSFLNNEAAALAGETEMPEGDRRVYLEGRRSSRGGIMEGEIPNSPEEQLSQVRGVLDRLEASNRDTMDYALATQVHYLESLRTMLAPEVVREMDARISLIDCYVWMKRANGWIEQPPGGGTTIGQAAGVATERNHDLDREKINFFLNGSANGLHVARAWDLLQDANYFYLDRRQGNGGGVLQEGLVSKVYRKYRSEIRDREGFLRRDLEVRLDDDPSLGNVETNYYSDPNYERREYVRRYLVEEMGGTPEARKALQLAERLVVATAESSVFNRSSMTGNDQLSEMIGLRGYRKGRERPGRNRGPQIHLDEISGFGNSWLRSQSAERGKGRVSQPFYARDIDFSKIGEGNYLYYYSVLVSAKWHPLRELLLDREPDPKKIANLNFLQRAVDYFNKADPGGRLELRKWWVAGVLDLAATQANLSWTLRDMAQFKKMVAETRLSSDAGSFLSSKVWQEMDRKYHFESRVSSMVRQKGRAEFWSSVFNMGR